MTGDVAVLQRQLQLTVEEGEGQPRHPNLRHLLSFSLDRAKKLLAAKMSTFSMLPNGPGSNLTAIAEREFVALASRNS